MGNHSLSTTFVFLALLGLHPNLFGQTQRTSPPASAKPEPTAPTIRELTVDEVLGWRSAFVDLLDNDLAAVTNRYGPPDEIDDFPASEGARTRIGYKPSTKTNDRYMGIWAVNGKVSMVHIRPASYERLDVQKVLLRGWEFCFNTGITIIRKTGRKQGSFQATLRSSAAVLDYEILEYASFVHADFFGVDFYNHAGPDSPCTPQEANRNKQPHYE